MRRTLRGVSLPELLICCALIGIITTGVAQLVIHGLRYIRLTDAKLDLQYETLRAIGRLTRELSDSDQESYAYDNTAGNEHIVFASPRNVATHIEFDSLGRMLWPTQVCYYLRTIDGVPCLCRKMFVYTVPPASPPAPMPVTSIRDDASLPEIVVGRHVVGISFNKSTVCDIELKTSLADIKIDYGMKIQTQVYCRN